MTNGTFREKMQADVLRPTSENPRVSLGAARVLGLREKKEEIEQAEKGKEIGVLVSSQVTIQIGDKLAIRK